ncbi:MAG: TVP38/TMEM64 family protein [Bacillaceae bacterium]|nr:TVP38/TMEM64 family protein [Bacillaceae bacterium]
MEQWLLSLFESAGSLYVAAVISILLNTLVALMGVVPSIVITTANVAVFGLIPGFFVSFIGEVIGAQVAFYLYRKGLKKPVQKRIRHPRVKTWLEKREVNFLVVLEGRLIPFMPAGIVTFYAAVGSMSGLSFFTASTIGKIPAMILETLAAYGLVQAKAGFIQLGIAVLIFILGYGLWIRKKK